MQRTVAIYITKIFAKVIVLSNLPNCIFSKNVQINYAGKKRVIYN